MGERKPAPISRNSKVMSGAVVFSGTRVPVTALFDYLDSEGALAEFLHIPYAPPCSFPDGWDIRSTQRMRWQGKENSELLQLAPGRRFGSLITADRNMQHKQNPNTPLPPIVLRPPSLRVRNLQALLPQTTSMLRKRPSRTFHVIGRSRHPDRIR